MNKRTLLIIAGISISLCIIVFIVIAILQSQTLPPDNNPVSYASYPYVVENPTPKDLKNYIYALINKDDNIKIKTALNEELLVNIDTKNWKDLQWSEKGSYLSVLGESAKDIFNIYIYNISTQKWIQATLFDTDGVSSYKWIDNDTLLFTSGGWLHRYKYSSLNEIVKIYQTDGLLTAVSPNKTTVLLKSPNGVFQLLSSAAKLLLTLDQIKVKGTSEVLAINEIYYNADSASLFLVTSSKFYKWELGDKEAQEIIPSGSGVDATNLKLICSQNNDIVESYIIQGNTVKFYKLDSNTNKLMLSATKDFKGTFLPTSFLCNEDEKIEFAITNEDKNSWYQLQSGKIENLAPLDEAKEVAIK